MSIVWLEGFDIDRLTALLADVYSHVDLNGATFVAGRHLTSRALAASDAGTMELCTGDLGAGVNWIVRFAVNLDTTESQYVKIQRGSHLIGDLQLTLELFSEDATRFGVRISTGNAIAATGRFYFNKGVWHVFQLEVQIGPTTVPVDPADGWARLLANGQEVIPRTAMTTDDAGADADMIYFETLTDALGHSHLDDIIIATGLALELPDVTVQAAYPYLDSTPLDWTPTPVGAHYSAIDNPGDDALPDADFLEAADGDEDTVFIGPLNVQPKVFQFSPRLENPDAGGPHDFQIDAHAAITVLAAGTHYFPPVIADPAEVDSSVTIRGIA